MKIGEQRPTRYAELLAEKEVRMLTPKEQAELIALGDAELDAAIARQKTRAKKPSRIV